MKYKNSKKDSIKTDFRPVRVDKAIIMAMVFRILAKILVNN
jgi:hypothetical protein